MDLEEEIKQENLKNGLERKYEYIHSIILRSSFFVLILANVIGAYYNHIELSVVLSLSIYVLLHILNQIIKNSDGKVIGLGFLWLLWFVAFVVASGGKLGLFNAYYFFLFLLVLYQYPFIFFYILIFTLAFNFISFANLFEVEKFEFIAQNFLYAEKPTWEDFIIRMVLTNAVIAIVWRTSFLLKRNSLKNIKNEILQVLQSQQLEKNKAFAEEIAVGNFDVQLNASQDDILGKSLERMKENLQKAQEREHLEKEINDFKNIGLVEIGKILRAETHIEQMSNKIISILAKYMKIEMGAIYLRHEDRRGQITHIQLIAAFAYDKFKYLNLQVLPGSGLVGTAFLEKESIFLTEIPENYIKIKSALGEIKPKCLLLSPLISNDEVVGVLEIASIRILKDFEIEFVNTISESIASTILNVKRNLQTVQLLEEAKQLTVEMQEKEEELKQNMEEMKASQEETAHKINILEARLSKYESI